MTEAEWFACDDARELIGRGIPNASARKLRLFAVACCRCSRQLLRNPDHRDAMDLAERFADGLATERELAATYRRTDEFALSLRAGESEQEIRRWAEAVAVLNVTRSPNADAADAVWNIRRAAQRRNIDKQLVALFRDIVGNPFHPINPAWLLSEVATSIRTLPQFARWWFDPAWLTSDVLALGRGIYEERSFDRMPILAAALQEAGCMNADVLNHCRGPGPHVRGCWALDLVLAKE
jgi:hypothetical protein